MNNPLLDDAEPPAFDAVRPAHVTPALDRLLADAEAALAHAASDAVPPDYDALTAALEPAVERLERAWATVGHLQSVVDTPALRAAQADNLPRVTDFLSRLAADARLFAKLQALATGPGFVALPAVRRKVVTDALRDGVLGGAALQGAARTRFLQIQSRLAELSQAFGEHVLDATDAWSLTVPPARLRGVPADVVQAAGDGAGGCRLTLHAPCRLPVLALADDRALRQTVHEAHASLANDRGPATWDNAPLMQEIVALRHEAAGLLGHASHAEVSLARKMARTPAEVSTFLRDLAGRARPPALAELAALQSHARDALGLDALQPWDLAYVAEKLKQACHGIDDETLRPWLPLPRVIDGLLALVARLCEVEIVPVDAPAWHPDVRCLALRRGGSTVGGLYLDLYARPGKEAGAWMDEARGRWRRPDGRLQPPLAHLVCNFSAPVGGRPALLTHDDVVTLFHEVGHGLHHLLTQVDERALAGIAGVEWDAAELPSQFMENFAWAWDVLQPMTAHVDTGAPLPRALFDRLSATRHFGSGLRLLRQVEHALFDLRLHGEPGAAARVAALAHEVHDEVSVLPWPVPVHYPNAFTHIFDGGYAAGYYGYSWAEVLSADAFEAFEEAGLFDAATGRRWREQVLEVGGSRPALDSFVAFRGRPPRIDALLRHQGLA